MLNSYRLVAELVSRVLLENHNKPFSYSPPSSCSVKPFPNRVISTPFVSHMFTFTDTLTSRG